MSDFFDEVGENDIVILIEHDHSTGEESGQRAVDHLEAILLTEHGRAESRSGFHIFDTFSDAESAHSEGEVHGHVNYSSIIESSGFLIETAYGGGAYGGVETWEYVEYHTLTS